jgi:hypothetical protein
MQLKYLGLTLICAFTLVLPAAAHHSHGQYDLTTWTPFEGLVKEVHWLNPHSWIYLDVKDGSGQITTWALESASPREIQENGVKREDVKPGDTIKVRCHLLRDGSKGCLLGFITPNHGDAARGHGIEREWD